MAKHCALPRRLAPQCNAMHTENSGVKAATAGAVPRRAGSGVKELQRLNFNSVQFDSSVTRGQCRLRCCRRTNASSCVVSGE